MCKNIFQVRSYDKISGTESSKWGYYFLTMFYYSMINDYKIKVITDMSKNPILFGKQYTLLRIHI